MAHSAGLASPSFAVPSAFGFASAQSRTLTLFLCCEFSLASCGHKKTLRKGGIFYGALGGVRTHNLLIRSQMLYPIELRVH